MSSDDPEDPSDESGGESDPFEELAEMDDAEVETDPFDRLDADPRPGEFEEVEVETVDEDVTWEQLMAGEIGDGEGIDVDRDVENEAVVPKRGYCEQCEFFSAPPDVACSHPGTAILELVDMNHFRVSDCPVVARRREIGELTAVDEEAPERSRNRGDVGE